MDVVVNIEQFDEKVNSAVTVGTFDGIHSGHQDIIRRLCEMSARKNIKSAFFLTLGFTIIEIIGGILTNSTAIMADAVHDLGDSIALGQSWYFESISHKQGSRSYGR